MKNLKIIILLSENKVLLYSKTPLKDGDHDYAKHFRDKTASGSEYYPIILNEKAYQTLQEKSPPFVCRKVAIVSTNEITLTEAGKKNTTIAETFEKALASFSDNETIVILGDQQMLDTCLEKYPEYIESIIEVRFNVNIEVTPENPLFKMPFEANWFGLIKPTKNREIITRRYHSAI
jgi:dihydrofolate reductase